MKHHIMFTAGLLMLAIFGARMAVALQEPGLGWNELYLLGGLAIAGFLLRGAYAEWRHAKKQQES